MKFPLLVITSIILIACSSNEEALKFLGPYGVWENDIISIIVKPDNTYKICNENYCEKGLIYRENHSSLSVVLLDALKSDAFEKIRKDIKKCDTFNSNKVPHTSLLIDSFKEIHYLESIYAKNPPLTLGCKLSKEWVFYKTKDFYHLESVKEAERVIELKKLHPPPKYIPQVTED